MNAFNSYGIFKILNVFPCYQSRYLKKKQISMGQWREVNLKHACWMRPGKTEVNFLVHVEFRRLSGLIAAKDPVETDMCLVLWQIVRACFFKT